MPDCGSDVETLQLYVDGQWRPSSNGAYFDSIDPFTGAVWTRVPAATAEDVDEAVRAAHRAFATGP